MVRASTSIGIALGTYTIVVGNCKEEARIMYMQSKNHCIPVYMKDFVPNKKKDLIFQINIDTHVRYVLIIYLPNL